MQLSYIFIAVGLIAAAEACKPGAFGCGNHPVHDGKDGWLYVCNAASKWQVSANCGGKNCCRLGHNGQANCIC